MGGGNTRRGTRAVSGGQQDSVDLAASPGGMLSPGGRAPNGELVIKGSSLDEVPIGDKSKDPRSATCLHAKFSGQPPFLETGM